MKLMREEKALFLVKPLEREWVLAANREKTLREELQQKQVQFAEESGFQPSPL